MLTLAQIAWPTTIGGTIIAIIIIAGCVAVLFVVLNYLKLPIPGWVVNIFWIVVICFVAAFAVRLIMKV